MRTLPFPTPAAALAVACVAGAVLLAPAPVLGQADELSRPAGWEVRFDRPGMGEGDMEMFVAMPPGWHITTGPSGIFWDPDLTAEGDFRIEAEIYLFDPEGRRESFGIFFGGRDLAGDAQAYTYFLIRDGGQYIVKERNGADAPTLVAWTDHDAVVSWADREEGGANVLNTLAVESRAGTLHFFVNDVEVTSVPAGDMPVDGVVGLRVNHRLNLHVSRLEVMPLGG
ncbi:MAG: hypothetical protein HKO98_04335 [Gemmatimonadetes bacterium]|nr:hypothetical protein [Gemmatimonadota bacterium]